MDINHLRSKIPENLGFTLVELMVVIAVIGVVVALATPPYQNMIERNRLKQAVESLKSDMQFARTEAIKRSQNVFLSPTIGDDGTWCYGLNLAAACACGTAGSCGIKTVAGSGFSTAVSMTASTGTSLFDSRRGTHSVPPDDNLNDVTFVTDNYTARVNINETGRVLICTPADTTGLPGYPDC
ncbi:MAG: GspH/FimT family pseudopilin [Methylomonas sp.]|nr:GspH/FimT family pseudopilin [Methylomonas sp.]